MFDDFTFYHVFSLFSMNKTCIFITNCGILLKHVLLHIHVVSD